MMRLARALVMLGLVVASCSVYAHKVSTAYMTLTADQKDPQLFHGQWDLAILDLDFVLGLDANGDGDITWGELQPRQAEIARYAMSRLDVSGDGFPCHLAPGKQAIDSHTDGSYVALDFEVSCASDIPSQLRLDYRLFAEVDPSHRGIITLRDGEEVASALAAPGDSKLGGGEGVRFRLGAHAVLAYLAAAIWGATRFLTWCIGPLVVLLLVIGVFVRRRRTRAAKASGDSGAGRSCRLIAAYLVGIAVVLCALPTVGLPALVLPCGAAALVLATMSATAAHSDRMAIILGASAGICAGLVAASDLHALDLHGAQRASWVVSFGLGYACVCIAVAAIGWAVTRRVVSARE